jgi:hypothetical protein|tara:strand:+ start:4200 stop:4388 length:189 start_codon:yes stop_codon:yes gene_type:complete
MKIVLELEEVPDFDEQLIYVATSEMFSVELEIDGCDVALTGLDKDVAAWIAFHTFPTEMIEA